MKTLVAFGLVLGLLTPAAWAAAPAPSNGKTPVVLTGKQMEQVRAGTGDFFIGWGTGSFIGWGIGSCFTWCVAPPPGLVVLPPGTLVVPAGSLFVPARLGTLGLLP
jgi:hypothetical protein